MSRLLVPISFSRHVSSLSDSHLLVSYVLVSIVPIRLSCPRIYRANSIRFLVLSSQSERIPINVIVPIREDPRPNPYRRAQFHSIYHYMFPLSISYHLSTPPCLLSPVYSLLVGGVCLSVFSLSMSSGIVQFSSRKLIISIIVI